MTSSATGSSMLMPLIHLQSKYFLRPVATSCLCMRFLHCVTCWKYLKLMFYFVPFFGSFCQITVIAYIWAELFSTTMTHTCSFFIAKLERIHFWLQSTLHGGLQLQGCKLRPVHSQCHCRLLGSFGGTLLRTKSKGFFNLRSFLWLWENFTNILWAADPKSAKRQSSH